jgi:hypothetical protein
MAIADPREQIEWRLPYYAATALAIVGTTLLVRRGAILNRIYLGISLYFVSGTLGLLTRWPWINIEYGRLEGTAMMYWVLATGIYFTLFDTRGFIGLDADRRKVRLGSWLLLGVALAASVVSTVFIGNRLFSSFLPFIALFTAHGIIKARLR